MRILIVEDELITRVIMERSLEKLGYDVVSVDNINLAKAIIESEKIQFVITDWIMPGGNGNLLCQCVRALNLPFYTYMILVTSLEDSRSVVEGMDAGADDFIRKPIQLEELHARIRAGERILALEKNLKAAYDVINRDVKMAETMQRSWLPSAASTVQNIAIDWLFHPSTYGSGDAFNYFQLDEHHIGFYMIDVAGHGIASNMLSFTLSKFLSPDISCSILLKYNLLSASGRQLVRSAPAVVTNLNQDFQTDANITLYFTMIYGVIDTLSRSIDLCQAGHPHPLYLHQGKPAEFITHGGLPVGVIADVNYESVFLTYCSGDRLFLYSDGITECESLEGEMFGNERLRMFIDETRHLKINEVISQLNKRIKSWRGIESFEDDISMLVLEFL